MPIVFVTLEVRPDIGSDDLIYTERRVEPLEWIMEERYKAYLGFDFEEMVDRMRTQLNGAQ